MMFSSRPPFNDDPYPWRYWPLYGQSEVREVRYRNTATAMARGAGTVRYAPRPEFDRPQRNPTNPILDFAREYVSGRFISQSRAAAAILKSWGDLIVVEEATSVQAEHARRVLTRLAKVQGGS